MEKLKELEKKFKSSMRNRVTPERFISSVPPDFVSLIDLDLSASLYLRSVYLLDLYVASQYEIFAYSIVAVIIRSVDSDIEL
jgi:hypothetical protein